MASAGQQHSRNEGNGSSSGGGTGDPVKRAVVRGDGMGMEAAQRSVLRRVFRREGEGLVFDPATLETPLSAVVDAEEHISRIVEDLDEETLAIIEERMGQRIEDIFVGIRNHALQVLLDWMFGKGPLPRQVLKRLYGFVRVFSPDHVWRMNQTDLGELFGETRAAVCEREKQEVEAFMRLWMMSRWVPGMGNKGEEARAKYSELRKGNCSRRGGKKVEHLLRDKGQGEREKGGKNAGSGRRRSE